STQAETRSVVHGITPMPAVSSVPGSLNQRCIAGRWFCVIGPSATRSPRMLTIGSVSTAPSLIGLGRPPPRPAFSRQRHHLRGLQRHGAVLWVLGAQRSQRGSVARIVGADDAGRTSREHPRE